MLLPACGGGEVPEDVVFYSVSPGGSNSVTVFCEPDGDSEGAWLGIRATGAGKHRLFDRRDIARESGLSGVGARYVPGASIAEIAWPSESLAILMVTNGAGLNLFAIDFPDGELRKGGDHAESIRQALAVRYKFELNDFEGDPLQWARTPDACDAFRWRSVGNGRLMNPSYPRKGPRRSKP